MVGGLALQLWCLPSPAPAFVSFPRVAGVARSSSLKLPEEAFDDDNDDDDDASSSVNADVGRLLSARERRQLRNERREGGNWREAVEERLMKKPKKLYASWTEKLNLDNLALLGPQWWVVRVSRVNGHETADRLARLLARSFHDVEFKVYYPAVKEQKKLKNGLQSTKFKPLFPGCVFLHCVMNKELHDFIREVDGIGGFVGSKVGNTKRQINKPKPVPIDEMEAIFKQAREEQKNADEASKEEEQEQNVSRSENSRESRKKTKSVRKVKKTLEAASLTSEDSSMPLTPGGSVHITSGPFAGFVGCLKELNKKSGKATIGLKLFGKESFIDVELDQIANETT